MGVERIEQNANALTPNPFLSPPAEFGRTETRFGPPTSLYSICGIPYINVVCDAKSPTNDRRSRLQLGVQQLALWNLFCMKGVSERRRQIS
jgi:hypothetical protein